MPAVPSGGLRRLRGRVAALIPGPSELLPGCPDAVVDLQTDDGAELVGAQWRYSDARVNEIDFVEVDHPDDPLGPGVVPNRTFDVEPHAAGIDFDDSNWRALAPSETQLRLSQGRVCFNWYRINETIPDRVGEFDPTGASVVFEVVIDDYAEVWVNGQMPHALGDTGGNVAGGFNATNRVLLTDDARPGEQFQIAVFGFNGPISASPHNYIWMRTATLDFYSPERARAAPTVELELERYSGRQKPARLLSKLRRAPEGRVGEAELAARRALVLALVAAIGPLVAQIRQLDRQIASALREHPDGAIFTSLFKDPDSVICAAQLLSEVGDCRVRYLTGDALAADAGQAAIAIESGKRKAACFRWACNRRLRSAFCTLADSTRHWHP